MEKQFSLTMSLGVRMEQKKNKSNKMSNRQITQNKTETKMLLGWHILSLCMHEINIK